MSDHFSKQLLLPSDTCIECSWRIIHSVGSQLWYFPFAGEGTHGSGNTRKHLITTELYPQPSGFVFKTEFHFVVQIGVNMPSSYIPSTGLQVRATMSYSFLLECGFSEAGRQGWGCTSPPGWGGGGLMRIYNLSLLPSLHSPCLPLNDFDFLT